MDAENTWQVNDSLWTSGQLSERDIARLPALEIAAVINLAMPASSNALRDEAELVTSHGISYFHIPVVWEAPQLEQLLTFFDILDALKGRKVWVHCAKNMRVSAFIYLYRRLRLQEPEAMAIFPMQAIWAPNATWQKFIDDVLASNSSKLGEG